MPYLNLPSGNSIKVPDGMSYETALEKARAQFPAEFGIKPESGIIPSAKKGWEQFKSSSETGIRSLLGNPAEEAAAGLERQQAIGSKYADQVGWDKVAAKYNDPNGGILSAAGEVARQVPYALAEQAPNIAASMGGARLGAMAGSPFGPVGAVIGGGLGAFAPSMLQQFGGNIERQQEVTPGQISVGKAALSAAPQATLDVAATFIPLGKTVVGKLLGPKAAEYLKNAGSEATEKLARESLSKTLGKGLAVGAAAEIPTEVAQQMLERAQAGLSLTDQDAMNEYGRTAYQVGLLAPIGSAGRFVDRSAARGEVQAKTEESKAKAARDALAAETARKQTPEYLQQLSKSFDDLSAQHKDLSDQYTELTKQIKSPDLAAEDRRALLRQRNDLKLERDTVGNKLKPVRAEYTQRLDEIDAAKEQARIARMTPEEYAYGVNPTDTGMTMADVGEWTPPAAAPAPAAQPFNAVQAHLERSVSPMVRVAGEEPTSVLAPHEVVQALLKRPDLAKRVVEGSDLFPGAKNKSESTLWKNELKKQLKPILNPPVQDSGQLPITAYAEGLDQLQSLDQEALGQQIGAGREEAARQSALARRAADAAAQREQARQAAEAEAARTGTAMQESAVAPAYLAKAVDEATLTPRVSKALGIEHPDGENTVDLTHPKEAQRAAPAIDVALQTALEARQRITENATSANTAALPKLEVQIAELQRLRKHVADATRDAADEAFIEGQLQAATPRRTPSIDVGQEKGLQPQQYGERARALATQHEYLTGELYSQLDELARGTYFRDPNADQREGLFEKPVQRQLDTKQAMQLEQTLVRKVQEAKTAIVQNALKEAASRREAAGLPGLTHADAIRASLDIKSAIDALLDKARRVDDSATTFVHDPTKDKITHDSYGHVWVLKGGKSITEQQARAKDDPVYGNVRSQSSFADASNAANAIIEQARQALVTPKPPARGPAKKGPFALAPQTEAGNQAIEARVAGAKLPAGDMRDNRRIKTTIDRIDAIQRPGHAVVNAPNLLMTRGMLAKVRQFLLGMTEVTARDEHGAATEARLTTSKAGTEFLDNVDRAIERVQKGLGVDAETGRAIMDRMASIEREMVDQRNQGELFPEATSFMAKTPEEFRKAADRAHEAAGYPTSKYRQWLERLNDNIYRARQKVARLSEAFADLTRARGDLVKLESTAAALEQDLGRAMTPVEQQLLVRYERSKDIYDNARKAYGDVEMRKVEAERELRYLEEQQAILKSMTRPLSPEKQAALLPHVASANAANAALQKALLKARAANAAAERAAQPAEKQQAAPNTQGVFPEERKATPGTDVTKSTVETVPIVAKRGGKKYELSGSSYDEEGNYIAPPQRQVVQRSVVQTPEERKAAEREALKEKVREQMEDRARQQKLKEELRAGKRLEKSPEETRAMIREAIGATKARKENQITRPSPNMGKSGTSPFLRTSKLEPTEPLETAPPESKLQKRKVKSLKNQAQAEDLTARVPVAPRLKERVAKAKADKLAIMAKRDAIRQQHEARALEMAAKKKPSVQKSEVAGTGASSVEDVQTEIANEFGDTKGRVTVVPTKADLPGGAGRAVTIDGDHVYIAADQVAPGQARGLVLHELGVHVGMDADTVATLHARLEEMARNGEEHSDLAAKALALQKKSTSTDTRDEAVAHFVELAANAGIKPTAGTAKFFKPFVDMLKRIMAKFGLRNDKLSAQDIVDYARGAVDKALKGRVETTPGEVQFSSTPKYADDYDERARSITERLIASPTPFRRKMRDFVMGFRVQGIDSFDAWEKIGEWDKAKTGDPTRGTQMMYWLRFYKQINNLMGAVALKGSPTLSKLTRKDGSHEWVVDVKDGASLQGVLKHLRADKSGNLDAVDREFKTYLIAERALGENGTGYQSVVGFLPEDGNKQPTVSEEDLKFVLERGRANPAFQAARKEYKAYSDALIDFNVAMGSLSAKSGELLKSQGDYVSFYRQDGDSLNLYVNGERLMTVGSIKTQPYLKELAGGSSQITGFMEGAMQNTHLLMDMALRNKATQNAMESLAQMGLAQIRNSGKKDPMGKDVVHFRSHGVDKFAVLDTEAAGVPTELATLGLSGIATQMPAALRLLGVPARLLRHFIVRNPVYAARQLFRDSMVNSLLAGVDGAPVLGPFKEVVKALGGRSTAEESLQRKGIVGGLVFTGNVEDRAAIIKQMTSGEWSVGRGLAALDFMAMQADAAARVQAYNSALSNGLSEMEARMAALETMNFQRKGVSPTLHVLANIIPFMNAQIQGLDVLYRSLTGKMPFADRLEIRRKLLTRGAMMAGATLMYASAMSDDDDYLNASAADRYNNWYIPLPGVDAPLRIPIPFEAGVLFKAVPEALFNVAVKDHDAGETMAAFAKMVANAVPGMVPQGVKPLIEDALNKDFYAQRDIEDARMQGLKIGERYGDRTSGLARALGGSVEIAGREIGVSPARIDHLVRGYTGSLGMALVGLADGLVSTSGERPTRKINETPVLGPLFLERDATAAINSAYTQIENYVRAKATFDKMVGEGRGDDAVRFAEKFSDQLAKANAAAQFKSELGKMTKLEAMVRINPAMSGDEKRATLDQIRKIKIDFSRAITSALKGEVS